MKPQPAMPEWVKPDLRTRSPDWYRAHFPYRWAARGEASLYFLDHPLAAARGELPTRSWLTREFTAANERLFQMLDWSTPKRAAEPAPACAEEA